MVFRDDLFRKGNVRPKKVFKIDNALIEQSDNQGASRISLQSSVKGLTRRDQELGRNCHSQGEMLDLNINRQEEYQRPN